MNDTSVEYTLDMRGKAMNTAGLRERKMVIATFVVTFLVFAAVPFHSAHADEPAGESLSRHDLVFLPAYRLAEMIRTGKVTSREAVEAYLEQIAKFNPGLNAIVTLDADGARKRADEADKALSRGENWGVLHGVPVTIKDNYATGGIKSTNGMTDLAGYVPKYDAALVKRVKNAGAVILGKTNLPPLGMDLQTRNKVFGVTNNPWDLKRTCGGSSGGEASAVASGMTALGFGNDIGGSIRIPSHFCGIYGIKPTENSTSTFGVSPGMRTQGVRAVRHLTCAGPLGRSIEDLKLGLSVIAGPDLKSPDIPWVDLRQPSPKNMNRLHITWTDNFDDVPVTTETKNALKAFTERLAAQGCTVERLSGPMFDPHLQSIKAEAEDFYNVKASDTPPVDFKAAWTTYGCLMDLELGSYQPSFFRFLNYISGWWYRNDVPMISMVFPHSYKKYLETMTRRDFFVSAMDDFLSNRDVLLCPVTSTPAFEHIEPWMYFGPFPVYTDPVLVDGKPVKYLVATMSYTSIFNLTGNPVVVIPIGYTKTGLPIGVQIVGKRWRDMELLGIAEQLDKVAAAYRKPAGY